jgi:hypothetical protein
MTHYERGIIKRTAAVVPAAQQADWDEELDPTNVASVYSQGAEGWSLTHKDDIVAGVNRRGGVSTLRYLWKSVFICDNLVLPMDVYIKEYGHTVELTFAGIFVTAVPVVPSAIRNDLAGGTLLPASVCPYATTYGLAAGFGGLAGGVPFVCHVSIEPTGIITIPAGVPGSLWLDAFGGWSQIYINGFTVTYDTMKP